MSVAAADGGVSVREEAFIGGERCGAGDGSLSVVNPATGAAVGTVPVPGRSSLQQRVQRQRAFHDRRLQDDIAEI